MKTPIDMIRVRRGHESENHRAMKHEAVEALHTCGYDLTLCEHGYCDVVGLKMGGPVPQTIAVEIERSSRNILQNVGRDFAQGCNFVLVVCPSFQVVGEVARKLARELPQEFAGKTGVANSVALCLLHPPWITEGKPSEKENQTTGVINCLRLMNKAQYA